MLALIFKYILNDMMVNMYYQILILWGQNLTDHLI